MGDGRWAMGEKESISGMEWGGMFGAYEVLREIVGLRVGLKLSEEQANGSHASPKASPSLSPLSKSQPRRLCQMKCSPIRSTGYPVLLYIATPVTSTTHPPATPNELLE